MMKSISLIFNIIVSITLCIVIFYSVKDLGLALIVIGSIALGTAFNIMRHNFNNHRKKLPNKKFRK